MPITVRRLRVLAFAGGIWLAASFTPLVGIEDKPLDACEVLKNPEGFYGKHLRIRGVFVQHVEGAFLIGYPKCEGVQFPIVNLHGVGPNIYPVWNKGGGSIGAWMLSDMTGRFDKNSNGGYEFSLDSLVVIRKVKPYALPSR